MRVRQIEEPDFLYHSDSNMREFYQSIQRITNPVFTIVRKDILIAEAYFSSLVYQNFSQAVILSVICLPITLKKDIEAGIIIRITYRPQYLSFHSQQYCSPSSNLKSSAFYPEKDDLSSLKYMSLQKQYIYPVASSPWFYTTNSVLENRLF